MTLKRMNVLCVMAHPDDETIGCGGTLARHAARGDDVRVLAFTDGVGSRGAKSRDAMIEASQKRYREWLEALQILGVMSDVARSSISWLKDYPDQALDTVPVLELAREVSIVIKVADPEVIYTHWRGDLNQDHRAVAEAVLIATRFATGSRVKRLLACEIPESTSQAFGFPPFQPNVFVNISDHLRRKARALRCYKSERREPPHPRSEAGVVTHAGFRGGAAGLDFAEAFVLLREVVG